MTRVLIGLPSSVRRDQVAELELDVRPLVFVGEEHDDQAVLLLTARVVDGLGQGATPWLTEFELFLRQHGFGRPASLAGSRPSEWSLRVESGQEPQWIALRTASTKDNDSPRSVLRALA